MKLNPLIIYLSILIIYKGGKIVLLDTEQYIKDCKKQLQNETFYQVLEHDPTKNICQEIRIELNEMITNNK